MPQRSTFFPRPRHGGGTREPTARNAGTRGGSRVSGDPFPRSVPASRGTGAGHGNRPPETRGGSRVSGDPFPYSSPRPVGRGTPIPGGRGNYGNGPEKHAKPGGSACQVYLYRGDVTVPGFGQIYRFPEQIRVIEKPT